jgi:hypothetical protein
MSNCVVFCTITNMSATSKSDSVSCIIYRTAPAITLIKHEVLFDRCKISMPDVVLTTKDNIELDDILVKWNDYILNDPDSLFIIKLPNKDIYCHIKTKWTATKKKLFVSITLNYRSLFCQYESDYILSAMESFKTIIKELVKTIVHKFEESRESTFIPFYELCDEIEMKLYEPNKREVNLSNLFDAALKDI